MEVLGISREFDGSFMGVSWKEKNLVRIDTNNRLD